MQHSSPCSAATHLIALVSGRAVEETNASIFYVVYIAELDKQSSASQARRGLNAPLTPLLSQPRGLLGSKRINASMGARVYSCGRFDDSREPPSSTCDWQGLRVDLENHCKGRAARASYGHSHGANKQKTVSQRRAANDVLAAMSQDWREFSCTCCSGLA